MVIFGLLGCDRPPPALPEPWGCIGEPPAVDLSASDGLEDLFLLHSWPTPPHWEPRLVLQSPVPQVRLELEYTVGDELVQNFVMVQLQAWDLERCTGETLGPRVYPVGDVCDRVDQLASLVITVGPIEGTGTALDPITGVVGLDETLIEQCR